MLVILAIISSLVAMFVTGGGTSSGISSSSSSIRLYDLDNDPTESNGFTSYDDDIITSFEERQQYWSKLVVDPQIPDSTNMYSTFKKNGGMIPWLTDDDEPVEVKLKYTYADAPHIVFVLVDDWGWNDVGWRSTYLSWATPTIDRLAAEGIKIENHYSHELCSPSRGALLTGRFALRLGLWDQGSEEPFSELPLNEFTLAQELKSAGYRTVMIGKWDLGFSTVSHTPLYRGFDSFYGYYSSFLDYWTKEHKGYLDLQDGLNLVSDKDELSSATHSAYLIQEKVETAIETHANDYPNQPMFLYYSMQLTHGPWSAPQVFLDRCAEPTTISDPLLTTKTWNYCGLNVMLDEAIANLTCALVANGMGDNTVMVIVSDKGGEKTVQGNSYPFKGHKGAFQKGGVAATALVHSRLLPSNRRGVSFTGTMHISDWLPTLMHLATDGQWTGSYTDAEIDGVDMWPALYSGGDAQEILSSHDEIVFYVDPSGTSSVIQLGKYKCFNNMVDQTVDTPAFTFTDDLSPESSFEACANPSLMASEDRGTAAPLFTLSWPFTGKEGQLSVKHTILVISMCAVVGILLWVHVWARNYLGPDERGMRSGLVGLSREASRGGYQPLVDKKDGVYM